MSFNSLLDHRARIWRYAEGSGTYGETTISYEVVIESARCTLRRKVAVLSDAGPGTIDSGDRTLYFRKGVRLVEKDLVELIGGPDAPAWLQVESSSKPRGHHVEARCSEYHGNIPEAGS